VQKERLFLYDGENKGAEGDHRDPYCDDHQSSDKESRETAVLDLPPAQEETRSLHEVITEIFMLEQ
jgi:hypothetical protein